MITDADFMGCHILEHLLYNEEARYILWRVDSCIEFCGLLDKLHIVCEIAKAVYSSTQSVFGLCWGWM